ncbi:MAG: hypothetical protein AAF656_02155 [Planctomycetota bacterium]
MLSMTCPSCGQKIKYREEHAGKRLKCPACGEKVQTAAGPKPGSAMAMPGTAGVSAGMSASGRPLDKKKELKFEDKRMPIYVKTLLVGLIAGFIVGGTWGLMDGLMFSAGAEAQNANFDRFTEGMTEAEIQALEDEGIGKQSVAGGIVFFVLIRGAVFGFAGCLSGFLIGFTGNPVIGVVSLVIVAPFAIITGGFFGIVDIVIFAAIVIPVINQLAE